MMFSPAQQRALVFAATFFFIASVYLCTTRLFAMSFSHRGHSALFPLPPPPSSLLALGPADLPMSYGRYGRPRVEGLASVTAALPPALVPSPANRRRLVVVADVHGMDAALARLLRLVRFDPARDHVVAVGDMLAKGPASLAVLQRLMRLNASAVRGNHEDRVLLARAEADAARGLSAALATPDEERRRGETALLALARSLAPDQVAWLAGLPVVLRADPLPLYLVHAGLVPGVALDRQDPWAAINMRSLIYPRQDLRRQQGDILEADLRHRRSGSDQPIEPDSAAPDPDRAVAVAVDHHAGEPWAAAWNRHQERLPHAHRCTVIYGHDAKRGFAPRPYSLGLDTGCVRGGALTAAIIEAADDAAGFTSTTMQVPCQHASDKA